MRRVEAQVLIVGAGPAGLAAAASAAASGADVCIVDDNPAAGGQIWRGSSASAGGESGRLLSAMRAGNIRLQPRTRVIAPLGPTALLAETPDETLELHYRRLILATGARELFLPFPGWTLPGVMGAGGLQALAKGGLPIAGKRVVVAGSGPLLLAVAAHLKAKGAQVLLIAEQTPAARMAAFGLNLLRYAEKFQQGGGLALALRGTPLRAGVWVSQAHGDGTLESVTITNGRVSREIACDYLACGYGLVPNTELAAALGCTVSGGVVRVDTWQRTGVAGVLCAGEATGIGGVELSLVEGRIAGLVAANRPDDARRHFGERERARRFAALLARGFKLRDELKGLAEAGTIVCRCEDVGYGRLREHSSWRSAKLHTRCGMGPCQGRICGAATGFLFGWSQDSVRPPVAAARVESLVRAE